MLTGVALSAASAGLFLLPVLLAVLGAMICGSDGTSQFLGALAGLGSGMLGSILVARLLKTVRQTHVQKETQ